MGQSPVAALAAIASKQLGLVTRAQALRCGFSPSAIKRLVASGRLIVLHRGVYRDAAVPRQQAQGLVAALLACGPSAAASHCSAALLWQLEVPAPAKPEVTVPCERQPQVSGIAVYRTRCWSRADIVTLQAVRVTSPMRTLIDIAAAIDEATLEQAHDSLWRRRLVTPERVTERLARPSYRSRAGAGVLRHLVADRLGRRATDSELETLYFSLLRRYRLPLPATQYDVWTPTGMRRLDYAYGNEKVAIELDSYEHHAASRSALDEHDARQNDLEALGWTFRRFTKKHIKTDPVGVVLRTADAIGRRPTRWA